MASGLDGRIVLDDTKKGPRLDLDEVAKVYGRWAPVYNAVFGPVFARGRSLSTEADERIGGRVLEVGVGTGLSLPAYKRAQHIVGVDISAPMLEKARKRVRERGLANVEDLRVMNAERLEFEDDAFDVVVAQYMVTAVPSPEAALAEFARVLKPGGEIVLTSRVGAEGGLRKHVERALSPIAVRLGWRTEFPWERYHRWIDATPGLALVERRALPPLGHLSLIRIAKTAA